MADRAALAAYRDMLVTMRDRVKPLVGAGRTLEQVKAARPTQDLDGKWGQGSMKPDVWLGIAYASLKGR